MDEGLAEQADNSKACKGVSQRQAVMSSPHLASSQSTLLLRMRLTAPSLWSKGRLQHVWASSEAVGRIVG